MQQKEQAQPVAVRVGLYILGAVLALAGLFFVIGGGKLMSLGGSWYFVLAGLGLLAAGVQIIRRRTSGAWLYLLTFALTVVWALAEVGWDYWSLVSRLLALTFGAAVVAVCMPCLYQRNGERMAAKGPFTAAAVLLVAGVAGFVSMFQIHPEVTTQAAAATRQPVDAASEQKTGTTTAAVPRTTVLRRWIRST